MKGVLDLRQWSFEENGNVTLNGEWEFYWNQLLQHSDFNTSPLPAASGFVQVPSVWENLRLDTTIIHDQGYATYRLMVKTNQRTTMALKVGDIATAATIYVDGQKIYQAGKVGTSRQTMQPQFVSDFVWFEPQQASFTILVQVSNFHHRSGGIWNLMHLGRAQDIKEAWFRSNGTDFFLIGGISLMAFYHLVLFLFRKKSRSSLYFSLFCGMVMLRSASTANNLLTHFIAIRWDWLIRLEYIGFFLGLAFFVQFFASLFSGLFPKILLKVLWIIAICFSLVVLTTPPPVFSHLSFPYQMIGLGVTLYIFYLAVVAYQRRLLGSTLFLIGYFMLLASFIHDILFIHDLVYTGYIISYGLLGYIIFQTFILSQGFSLAFGTQEKLNDTLEAKNQQIEEQNTTLKQLNEELDNFVYRTSHDLRAPIASVLGLIDLIRMDDNREHLEEYVTLQEKSLLKLDGFIQDILHYSRNTRLEPEVEEIHFQEIIEEVFSLYHYLEHFDAIKKRVTISQSDVFISDAKRLKIIFNNLISNAIRYCNPHQPAPFIHITIEADATQASVTVSDNGQGIAEEHLDKIFTMFYRASNDAKGSGLGLFLVRETVQKLKGEVHVSSVLHQGTKFYLTIPNGALMVHEIETAATKKTS